MNRLLKAMQKQCLFVFAHFIFQALFSDKFGKMGVVKPP
jgi:hypothetical protein